MALAVGTLQPTLLGAQHLALGAGMSFADHGAAWLGGKGFTSYLRMNWGNGRTFSLVNDLWFISVPDLPQETPPCPGPQCGPAVFTSNETTALVLTPALVARQGYEKAALLYRLGPTASWFANRTTGTPALAAGVQAGLSVLTTRRQNGMLISIDYMRTFRGSAHPRWFVPITVGWQF